MLVDWTITILATGAPPAVQLDFMFLLFDWFFSPEPLVEIQRSLGTEWEQFVHGLALLGDSRLILVVAVMLFWYVGRHRPYQVLAASLLGAGLGSLLKILFDQPRPADPELLLYSTTTSPSFPSGHVILAACFWGTLAWYGWIPRWVAALFVALVMFARVYLGVHFVGDVLFGAIVGIAWLALFHRWIGPWLEQVDPARLSKIVALAMAGSFAVLPVTSAFPFGWEIVGALAGAGIGIIVQEWRVKFRPASARLPTNLLKALTGLAGVILVIVVDFLIGPEIMAIELALYFVAAIWALLIAPMLFVSLGLGTRGTAVHPAA